MKSNMKDCLKFFDMYSRTFQLHLFGKEEYKTITGFIFTLMSVISILAISYFFINDFLNRKSMTLNFNSDTGITPLVNLSEYPIFLEVGNSSGKTINSEKLFSWDVKILNYKRMDIGNNQTVFGLEVIPVTVENCENETSFGDYKDLVYSSYGTGSFHCIPAGKYNTSIYGKVGDTVNGWSNLIIFVNRCDSRSNECYNETITNNLLGNVVINVAFVSYDIDNYNLTKPYNMKIQSFILPISTTLFKSYWIQLKQVIYDTDYGWVFEDHRQDSFFIFDSYSTDVSLNNLGLPSNGSPIGCLIFQNSEASVRYYRSYNKAQNLVANIGGIINSIVFISQIITSFLTRRFFLLHVANHLFDFESEFVHKKEVVDINKYVNKNKNPEDDKSHDASASKFVKSNNVKIYKQNKNVNNFQLVANSPNKHLQQEQDNNPIKLKTIKFNFFDYFLPKCFRTNRNLDIYYSSEKIIRKKISVETLIQNHYQIINLAKLTLRENQLKQFGQDCKIVFNNEEEILFDVRNKGILKNNDNINSNFGMEKHVRFENL